MHIVYTSLFLFIFCADAFAGPKGEKREGRYFTGIPAIAFNPDSGLIYGAVGFHFNNGDGADERFEKSPYIHKHTILAVQSTKGMRQIKYLTDYPRIWNTIYRVKTDLIFYNNISSGYYGSDVSSMKSLSYPEALAAQIGETRPKNYETYEENLKKDRDGITYARYNHFIEKNIETRLLIERPILNENVFVAMGYEYSENDVTDYSNKKVDAVTGSSETTAIMQSTKLMLDHTASGLVGYNGGQVSGVILGLSYDTRDYEPNPSSGEYCQLERKVFNKAIGSRFNYEKSLIGCSKYVSISEKHLFAMRAKHEWSSADTPFFQLPSLGGRKSLKGYRLARFRGLSASNLNVESRHLVGRANFKNQIFESMPVLFLDFGRVYDKSFAYESGLWRKGYGIGHRLIWNQATVIGGEYAVFGEEKSIYLDINHIF